MCVLFLILGDGVRIARKSLNLGCTVEYVEHGLCVDLVLKQSCPSYHHGQG